MTTTSSPRRAAARPRALLAQLCALVASLSLTGCGAFASVTTDTPFVSIEPNYAYLGDRRALAIRFPSLPPSTVATSHFTELDFGNQVLPSLPEFGDDGAIRLRVDVTRSAPTGDRFVRVGIATPSGQQYQAAAVFHILAPPQ